MNPLIKLIRHPRNVMSWVHLIISPCIFTSRGMKLGNPFECPSQSVDFCIHSQPPLSVLNSKLYLFLWWMFMIVSFNLKSRRYGSCSIILYGFYVCYLIAIQDLVNVDCPISWNVCLRHIVHCIMILCHLLTRNVNKRTSVEMNVKIDPRFNNQLRDISDEVNLSVFLIRLPFWGVEIWVIGREK